MSDASRIRWNSLFSFLTISTRLVANVLLFLLIARYYGAEIFGQFTFAHTLATLLILFADFGFDLILTLEVAKNRDSAGKIFQTFFSYKVIFSLAAIILMWIITLFNQISPEAKQLVAIFSFYVAFTALTNFIFALFKGIEKLQYETKVSFIINVGLLISTIVLALLHVSIIVIAITFVISRFLGLVLAIFMALKLIPNISFKPIFGNWKVHKNTILIFGVQLLFANLFFQLDTILLSFWKGDVEVGIYQAVFKLIMLALIIPDVFINALMPVLSRLHSENEVNWKKLGFLLNKILIIIVLPISLFVFIYADQIIHFIYSRGNYDDAIPVLKIFAFILFTRFSVETYALMLTTSGKQKYRMIVVVVATFLNLILNYFLIPKYGPYGAAITSLITNIIVGLFYILFSYPFVTHLLKGKEILVSIAFILVIGTTLSFLPVFSFWITMPIVLIIYTIYSWYYVFSSSEKDILFEGKLGLNTISIFLKGPIKK